MVAGRTPIAYVETADNVEQAAENMEAELAVVEVANVEVAAGNVGAAGANLEAAEANVEVAGANVEAAEANVEAAGANVEAAVANVEAAGANMEAAGANVEAAIPNIEAAAAALLEAEAVTEMDADVEEVANMEVDLEAEVGNTPADVAAEVVKMQAVVDNLVAAAAAESVQPVADMVVAKVADTRTEAPSGARGASNRAAGLAGRTKGLTNVVIPTFKVPIKKLDAKTKLIRFCYLGAFDCVALFRHRDVQVKKWLPEMKKICEEIDSQAFGEVMLKMLLQTPKLKRKDETLFAYACYLISDIDKDPKFSLRSQLNALVIADDDLFLFAKYAMQIQLAQKHKGFSKTHRKAIISWYNMRTENELNAMWMMHRGAYGFSHKSLILLCHIPEREFESDSLLNAYFRSCTELIREWESLVKIAEEERKKRQQQGSNQETVVSAETAATLPTPAATSFAEPRPTIFVLMSQLRTTTDNEFALKLIRELKLRYNQIPCHLLKNSAIVDEALETMSHWPLLRSWRSFHRFNHFKREAFCNRFKELILEKRGVEAEDIHPYIYLWKMTGLGLHPDFDRRAHPNSRCSSKHETVEGVLIKEIYEKSFTQNFQNNNFRMHITLNLQANYRKKMPQRKRKVSFLETSVALAFGYFQMKVADVFCWTKYTNSLRPVNFDRSMNIREAVALAQNYPDDKNKQLLTTPIQWAHKYGKKYDVFLVIVPTSGRGNKKMSSHGLCTKLDQYREESNPNAKFIILDLLKHKKSMTYSKERVENILNICGVDDNTPDLITAFINNELF